MSFKIDKVRGGVGPTLGGEGSIIADASGGCGFVSTGGVGSNSYSTHFFGRRHGVSLSGRFSLASLALLKYTAQTAFVK
jgi:hypothetical protein